MKKFLHVPLALFALLVSAQIRSIPEEKLVAEYAAHFPAGEVMSHADFARLASYILTEREKIEPITAKHVQVLARKMSKDEEKKAIREFESPSVLVDCVIDLHGLFQEGSGFVELDVLLRLKSKQDLKEKLRYFKEMKTYLASLDVTTMESFRGPLVHILNEDVKEIESLFAAVIKIINNRKDYCRSISMFYICDNVFDYLDNVFDYLIAAGSN